MVGLYSVQGPEFKVSTKTLSKSAPLCSSEMCISKLCGTVLVMTKKETITV